MFPILNTNLVPNYLKLTGYFISAVHVVSSNLCVGLSPRIKISLPLLQRYRGDLISASKLMTFFPMVSSGNENFERESYVVTAILLFI